MKTIVLHEPGRLALTDTPEPGPPGPGEALVRVRRVGVCGTDLHAFRGRQPFFSYPRILGHELGVEVVEAGPGVKHVCAGDRCAVEPYLNCGHCIACRRGRTNCCAELKVLGVHVDGGMRDLLLVPASKLHPSETLSLEQLALVETLGIGAHAVSRAQVGPGETVLVIGAGPIGLSVIQFALVAGARVIAMDLQEQRLAFARQHLGVEETLTSGETAVERLLELTGGDLPILVFDATGSAASMCDAFRYVANSGRLVLVGLAQADVSFFDPEFHRREMTLLSSRNSTGADFRRIIDLMERQEINTGPWITHRSPCDQLPEVFPGWLQPEAGVLKAMAEF